MEIRIGVQNVSREVVIETDLTSADIEKKVADAMPGSLLPAATVTGGVPPVKPSRKVASSSVQASVPSMPRNVVCADSSRPVRLVRPAFLKVVRPATLVSVTISFSSAARAGAAGAVARMLEIVATKVSANAAARLRPRRLGWGTF